MPSALAAVRCDNLSWAPWAPVRPTASDPFEGALDDDVTSALAGLAETGRPFALATIVAADGGPRPVGSQLLVTSERSWGFLSGGCVEDDVARHARAALRDGEPRRLAYGRGSPFFDIRLPCGGRIEVLVEAIRADDVAVLSLAQASAARRPVRYRSDGTARALVLPEAPPEERWVVDRLHEPAQRLIVVGSDPFALAIAQSGRHQSCAVALVRPGGRGHPAPLLDAACLDGPAGPALAALAPDAWTAIVVATHDIEDDEAALAAALRSDAGYVGALGSRRRLAERRARLLAGGLTTQLLDRLHAPVGLPIKARSPREVGLAVAAEVVALRDARRGASAADATLVAR